MPTTSVVRFSGRPRISEYINSELVFNLKIKMDTLIRNKRFLKRNIYSYRKVNMKHKMKY